MLLSSLAAANSTAVRKRLTNARSRYSRPNWIHRCSWRTSSSTREELSRPYPCLRDALKANANYAPVHWELGYAYRFAGMLNESVAECERARQLDPLVKWKRFSLEYLSLSRTVRQVSSSLPDANDSSFLLFYRGFGEYYQKDLEHANKDLIMPTIWILLCMRKSERLLVNRLSHRDADGLKILRGLETKSADRGVGDPEAHVQDRAGLRRAGRQRVGTADAAAKRRERILLLSLFRNRSALERIAK